VAEKKSSNSTDSSSEFLDVSVGSISGRYIELAEQGKLVDLVRLQKERERLALELNSINTKMLLCNDPIWLLNFTIRASRKGGRYGDKLRKEVSRLEKEKGWRTERLAKVEEQIRELEPSLLQIPIVPAASGSAPARLLPTPFLDVPNFRDHHALVRDFIIKRLCRARRNISDEEICAELDLELGDGKAPPDGIPDAWVLKYGEDWKRGNTKSPYSFYRAAYRDSRTKNSMQKMIATAKTRLA
jgi:hypothetical protein